MSPPFVIDVVADVNDCAYQQVSVIREFDSWNQPSLCHSSRTTCLNTIFLGP